MARQFVLIVEVEEGCANEPSIGSLCEIGAGLKLRAQEMPYNSTLVYQEAQPIRMQMVEGQRLDEWNPGFWLRLVQWMRRRWYWIKHLWS